MTCFNGLVGIVSNLVSVALYISFAAAAPFDPLLLTSSSFLFNDKTKWLRNLVNLKELLVAPFRRLQRVGRIALVPRHVARWPIDSRDVLTGEAQPCLHLSPVMAGV
jgi:hypothetical protein